MGSLSNLYISQSYTSLVHLGNDGPITNLAPGQFTELQDGLGNGLSIELNSSGDVNIGGAISASNIPADIATQSELNAYTASTNIRLNNIENTTASLNSSVTQLNASSASQQISINALNAFTASNSFSASIVQLNAFTQSANIRLTNLESTSASVNISISNINSTTASLNSFTSSTNVRLNNIEAKTGSYATTGSNTFVGANNFSSSVDVLGGLNVIVNSMTVGIPQNMGPLDPNVGVYTNFVYANSGYGQELVLSGDQMLSKGVRVTNGLSVTGSLSVTQAVTASAAQIAGLHYPTTDGTFTGQVLQTNAAGTLSFGNVNAVFETIRNGESTTITAGTPLYVSGTVGSNPLVYRANTSDPTKMPVTFLAMENIGVNQNGRGITLGLITGIDMTGYPVGTQLWVDGLGALTATRPTGSTDIVQPIGIVTKTGNGGQLNVLNPGPVLMPNIQTGYAWVGNGSNQPVAVATSSFGGGGTDISALNQATASLQAFTASAEIRLTNLETTTASLNVSITNLNASSASQQVSINALNVFTASQSTASIVNSITNLNSFTASANQRLTAIETVSGSWITESETSSFARYDVSNPWSAQQDFTTITATNATITNLHTVYETSSVVYSSGSNQFGDELTDIQTLSGSVKVQGSLTVNGTPVQTASFDASALNQATASLQAFTASANQRLTAIESVSGSWITESETGSFAKLDANQIFTGNNTFVGNTVVSQSAAFGTASFYAPIQITKGIVGDVDVTGSLVANKVGAFDFDSIFLGSQLGGSTANGTFFGYGSTDYTFTLGAYAGGFDNELQIYANNGGIEFRDFNGASYPSFLKLLPNSGTNPKPIFTRGLEVTGSTEVGTFTASLANGYVWVGNSNGRTITVATASFAAGGADLTQLNQASASLQQATASLQQTTASLNTFTASAEIRLTNLESTSASVNTSIANLNIATASLNTFTSSANQRLTAIESVSGSWITEAETGSFARLDAAQVFTANQTINGNLIVNGTTFLSASNVTGNLVVTGKATQTFNEPGDNQEVQVVKVNSFTDSQGYTMANNTLGWYHYNSEGHSGWATNLYTADYGYGSSMFHDPNKWEYTLFPSGAAYDTNKFGLYDNGNTTTRFEVLADNIQLTGSVKIKGTAIGNVASASITSNTASINLATANYYEVTSSVTPLHLNITNITPGVTTTLIISASASSSITFSPNVAQPSGSAYSGSAGSIDILSLVAFNASKVNVVATKAMI